MPITPIYEVQGTGLWSELDGQVVTVQGVVTGVGRRGFFLQSVEPGPDSLASDAIYVFSPKWPAPVGALLEVRGEVADFFRQENGKPVTQITLDDAQILEPAGPKIKAFELTAENVPSDADELAIFLNSLEGMLVTIAPGQTFIAPSNPFGDYVLILDAEKPVAGVTRTEQGGVLIDHDNPLRWFPGFRMPRGTQAPRLNVGSKLLSRITGPLNYRVEAFQIKVDHPVDVELAEYTLSASRLTPEDGFLTVMTLNGFNLDMHVESGSLVKNPRQDIDDDWGDGRFHALAEAVVKQANVPDVIALQEIQDNDGAEITDVVEADRTYQALIKTIKELCGIEYHWVDIAPGIGADGGQPGGSIRNAYLYNPERVLLIQESVRLIGSVDPAFEGSRKPLVAHFKEKSSEKVLACVNVHLASKRHQHSIFAPENAGHDARLPVRIAQVDLIAAELEKLRHQGVDYYLTGDFNDTEQSDTLVRLLGDENSNLVNLLAPELRYDYNHRGKLQVLMHGIVPLALAENRADYEIIHGNELIGVEPGKSGDKPSDHAYVLAKIRL